MKLRELGSAVLAVIAVGSAVVVTSITIRNEFVARHPRSSTLGRAEDTPVTNWQSYLVNGHRMGPVDAAVTIVEFADFECPACRAFTRGPLHAIRQQYPKDVAVVFHHWPLTYHRLAYPTARAAECAAIQGRFEAFHDLVYSKQDSLGILSFTQLAVASGVADSLAFKHCVGTSTPVALIEMDIQAAQALKADGTPAVLVNGLKFGMVPDSAVLERAVHRALLAARERKQ